MRTSPTPNSLPCVRKEIYDLLDEFGMPQHFLGYNYVAYGIEYLIDNIDRVFLGNFSITRELYPQIANIYSSSPSRVERAIRHSVEKCFDALNTRKIYDYFGNSIDKDTCKTTNTQFMITIASKFYRESCRES